MNKWGSRRVDGAERVVQLNIEPVPMFLSGKKVRAFFRPMFRFFSSLDKKYGISTLLLVVFVLTFLSLYAIVLYRGIFEARLLR